MYGITQASLYEKIDSFTYKQWFQSIYSYILSRTRVVTKTAAYSVEPSVFYIRADTTSTAFTITLPTAVHISGRQIVIKKIDASANNVTIDGSGAETIDGAATVVFNTQYESYTLISNGVNWELI